MLTSSVLLSFYKTEELTLTVSFLSIVFEELVINYSFPFFYGVSIGLEIYIYSALFLFFLLIFGWFFDVLRYKIYGKTVFIQKLTTLKMESYK